MKNIVIVAGGKGTRFEHLSVFPKILLPTKEENSILSAQVKFFRQSEYRNITVIINKRFEEMVNNYISVNNIDVDVIATDNENGSFNTIFSVYDSLPHEDVLFIWSDLIPKDYEILNLKDSYYIVTDNMNNEYRYNFSNGILHEDVSYKGNVPGAYYFTHLKREELKSENTDLIEYIFENVSMWSEYSLKKSFIEYRDLNTYRHIYKSMSLNVSKPRFFNEISVDDDVLTKRSVNDNYIHLITKEQQWYSEMGNNPYLPKIYETGDGFIKMEYLSEYKPLWMCLCSSNVKRIYDNIFLAMDAMSKRTIDVDKETYYKDLHKEIIDKTIDRCEKIKYMLVKYNRDECESYLKNVFNHFINLNNTVYIHGHGDLNGSNILVNESTGNIKIIDPRGYFGNTVMYVPRFYEDAKLLYCLYGYDDFNTNPKIYGDDEPIKYDNVISAVNVLDTKLNRMMVGVIYIALAGYISQDIMKANIAYEYGMKILKNEEGI